MNRIKLSIALALSTLIMSQSLYAKAPVSKSAVGVTSQQELQKINLNTAGAKEIAEALSGVGAKKAQAIVDYRKTHGEFASISELVNVKGIGASTLDKNKDKIVLH